MNRIILAAALLVAAASPALGQPSAGHLAAAMETVEAAGTEITLGQSIETMLAMQLEQNPGLRPFEAIMREFFARYMSWAALREDYAAIYADIFTEQELRELTAFYRTPLGRKVASTAPQLMARGAELGERRVQEHLPELQQMITEQMERSPGGEN